MGADVFCSVCDAAVADPRAHVDGYLHDSFYVRLPNGSSVSIGDAGVDQAAWDEQERRFEEARVRDAAEFKAQCDEHQQQLSTKSAELANIVTQLDTTRDRFTALVKELDSVSHFEGTRTEAEVVRDLQELNQVWFNLEISQVRARGAVAFWEGFVTRDQIESVERQVRALQPREPLPVAGSARNAAIVKQVVQQFRNEG